MADELNEGVGTIEGLTTVPGAGLAQLVIRDDDGNLHVLPCDAGPTFRALSNLAPSLLRGGASLRVRLLEGLRVRVTLDDLGLLETIAPADDEAANGHHEACR